MKKHLRKKYFGTIPSFESLKYKVSKIDLPRKKIKPANVILIWDVFQFMAHCLIPWDPCPIGEKHILVDFKNSKSVNV